MTTAADPTVPPGRKSLKLPLLIGVVLALAGGGGGFVAMRAMQSGADVPDTQAVEHTDEHGEAAPAVAYVALDPLLVNLPRATGRQFLRFAATLEVDPSHAGEVESLRPRIVDVMNSYLRAVEPADFENQMILAQLRSQLLRRIQVVAGEGRVRDLLVIEFVLD